MLRQQVLPDRMCAGQRDLSRLHRLPSEHGWIMVGMPEERKGRVGTGYALTWIRSLHDGVEDGGFEVVGGGDGLGGFEVECKFMAFFV